MPRTSSLGDIHRMNDPRPHGEHQVTVSVGEDERTEIWPRYERIVSRLACITLVACGIGVGMWASM